MWPPNSSKKYLEILKGLLKMYNIFVLEFGEPQKNTLYDSLLRVSDIGHIGTSVLEPLYNNHLALIRPYAYAYVRLVEALANFKSCKTWIPT